MLRDQLQFFAMPLRTHNTDTRMAVRSKQQVPEFMCDHNPEEASRFQIGTAVAVEVFRNLAGFIREDICNRPGIAVIWTQAWSPRSSVEAFREIERDSQRTIREATCRSYPTGSLEFMEFLQNLTGRNLIVNPV